jgi:hypothetical protein
MPSDPPELADLTEPGNRPRPSSSSRLDPLAKTQQTSALPPNVSTSPSRASVPPSEPRSASRASFSQLDIAADRPGRLQMIVALVLLLVLVAIPLYLWRRPRADSIAVATSTDAGVDTNGGATQASPLPDETKPSVGEAKSVLCQDPGPKKTAPDQCDHVVEVEKAFAKAIEESASCVPKEAGGGTIQYVADISFKRRAITVATPKDGRTMRNAKVVSACQSAVKTKLQAVALEPVTHAHARYKVSITASYPGTIK